MELSTENLNVQAGLEADVVVHPVQGTPKQEFHVEVCLEPAEKVQNVGIFEGDDGNVHVKFIPVVPGTYDIFINSDKLVDSHFTVQAEERRIDIVSKFDLKGDIPRQPIGIAVNSQGLIAVADIHRHCIFIFSEKGDFLRTLGCYGKNPGQMSSPVGVTFLNDDEILVADQLNHRIQQFNVQRGTFSQSFGEEGIGEGEFKNPVSVCMDGEGHVIVADCLNNRIQVLTQDGEPVLRFGDSGPGKLDHPFGCVSHRGRFIVSDSWNNCLKVFDSSGKFLNKIGAKGDADGLLYSPWGLCVEKYGNQQNLLVCDGSNGRIQQFTMEGRFTGKTVCKLQYPTALTTAPDGRILLCDLEMGKVCILK
ncbi:tripartite motif-containing protein 3-like [Stylophora pistillata]|uniref:E3 ubiquitin-protein ligase TRIM71 n=1 Tax=Stylophora pistillata TaxID=50429 RepID=A0A2B4SI48_STYPI|nr:tripartite motif-containing protein 3-like [Stylophora pistillata]PFX29056.1 E3 ubiquitin-protein ligase TRIM71 [Stylophora pistillata]